METSYGKDVVPGQLWFCNESFWVSRNVYGLGTWLLQRGDAILVVEAVQRKNWHREWSKVITRFGVGFLLDDFSINSSRIA